MLFFRQLMGITLKLLERFWLLAHIGKTSHNSVVLNMLCSLGEVLIACIPLQKSFSQLK